MNKFFALIALLTVFISCSSHKELKKEVNQQANAVTPVTDPRSQYDRAIAMIKENKELDEKQKKALVGVINEYASKSVEIRKKQSQYRVVLVNEMLNSGTKKNRKVDLAKKNLQKLEKESSSNLGKFIRDFKFHSGNITYDTFQPAIREAIRIQ